MRERHAAPADGSVQLDLRSTTSADGAVATQGALEGAASPGLVDAGADAADAASPAKQTDPLEATMTITGCDATGKTDVTKCISNFVDNNDGPAFYLAAGTYLISGQIYITSKRLYGNNSTSTPTKFVAQSGVTSCAFELRGSSSGMDWIELDA